MKTKSDGRTDDPGYEQWLNCAIRPGTQYWNAMYLDYQLSVLRSLIEADKASGGAISGCGACDGDDHPLEGIRVYLAEVLDKCGYPAGGNA